jgi:hypothetical protein
MRWLALTVVMAALGCGCGKNEEEGLSGLQARTVTLPNGKSIRAEVALNSFELRRGLMFRDSVPPGTGMLFIHDRTGTYSYYMFQVKIPLDMIWMDKDHRIVEIASDVPPCTTRASECPTYGGHVPAQYVLELGGGEAAKHGLRVGDTLRF